MKWLAMHVFEHEHEHEHEDEHEQIGTALRATSS
jgi:hypothetical protein